MKKQDYILGLDLGTGSVGWGCVLLNENKEPCRILDLGVRIFNSEGGSLKDRREARGTRRILRRRKARIRKTKNIFKKYNYLTQEEIDKDITVEKIGYDNPYEIRLKGKKELLSKQELYIILINYAKGRGFKSNRKIDDLAKAKKHDDKEGKLLSSIKTTEEELNSLKEGDADATITDLLFSDYQKKHCFRNSDSGYIHGITREMVEEEVEKILEKQIELGAIEESFKNEYWHALFKQLSFLNGPEEGPYHEPIKKMIGMCPFMKDEKRACKHDLSYLLFTLAQRLNDIRYYEKNDNYSNPHKLNGDQIKEAIEFFKNGKNIKYKDISKIIGEDKLIKNIDYQRKINENKRESTYVVSKNFGDKYIELHKALKNKGLKPDDDCYNLLAECFARCQTDEDIKNYLENNAERDVLKNIECPPELVDFAISYSAGSYSGFGNVSLAFIDHILPHLADGIDYYHACEMEKIDAKRTAIKFTENQAEIPVLETALDEIKESLTNRRVIRTVIEARKIVNKIIGLYGYPYEIHIEMGRDLTLSKKERDDKTKKDEENYVKKQLKINEIFNKFGEYFGGDIRRINSQVILKYDLWKEQHGIDLYTLAKTGDEELAKINERDLFAPNSNIEIEHIIPYSFSSDDRKVNKILVRTQENREKGDSIPGIYYENKPGYQKYCSYLKEIYDGDKGYKADKKERLLSKNKEDFKNIYLARTLNDTRYAMTVFKKMITGYFPKIRVRTFVGGVTARLRAYWHLNNLTTSYANENYDSSHLGLDPEKIESIEQAHIKLSDFINNYNGSVADMEKDNEYRKLFKDYSKLENNNKKNRDNHYHHAIDAIIIACATDSMRIRIQKQEIARRLHGENYQTFVVESYMTDPMVGEVIVDEDTGEIKVKKEVISKEEMSSLLSNSNEEKSKFPLPYPTFIDELKPRALEMDEEVLHNLLNLKCRYSSEDLKNVKPIIISHYFSGKRKGKMHADTYLGKRNSENKEVLTKRVPINSKDFKLNHVEEIYDKTKTQKSIYQVIREWIDGYNNGRAAYNAKGYPKNKNGREIKKVRISEDFKEQFELKENQGNYVNKGDNQEIWIYKKDDEDTLYFVGMDVYRILNALNPDKNIYALLWFKQGDNGYKKVLFKDLEKEGFKLQQKIIRGQTIYIETENGRDGLCLAVGSGSGQFEIKSLTGDDYDLYKCGLPGTIGGRHKITVSKIKSIKPVSIDVLGKIH